MPKNIFSLIIAVAVGVCTIVTAELHQIHFSNQEGQPLHNRTLSIAAGDEISISFYGLLSTGFKWSDKSKVTHLHCTGSDISEAPPNNYVWNYTAESAGDDTLEFSFGKPWESDPASIVTIDITISTFSFAKLLSEDVETFESWKIRHNKVYESEKEHTHRASIFETNKFTVKQHNAAGHSWTMGLNRFADLTPEEFSTRLGLKASLRTAYGEVHQSSGEQLDDSVDWRTKNAVTPVKNQGGCGSCWAFSTIVSMEGAVALKSGNLTSFSEQDLVDCVKNVNIPNQTQSCCSGCQGGLMDFAFAYMINSQKGGQDTESSYPYTGTDGSCTFNSGNVGGSINGWHDIPSADEKALMDAVATVGPISVGVDASLGWQLYFGGIMDPWPLVGCSSDASKIDHGVAVVGYGTDAGKDYWIIKNSWAASWGEKGYMRLIRNKNACGVANMASYPTAI